MIFVSFPHLAIYICSIQKICTQYKPQADSLEVELTPYIYIYITYTELTYYPYYMVRSKNDRTYTLI